MVAKKAHLAHMRKGLWGQSKQEKVKMQTIKIKQEVAQIRQQSGKDPAPQTVHFTARKVLFTTSLLIHLKNKKKKKQ